MGSSDGSSLTPTVVLRVQYALYLFVGIVSTMVLRGMLRVLSHFPVIQKGCEYAGKGDANFCAAEVLTYRVSFSLTVFFFLHLLSVSDLTCCIETESRVEFQRRFFIAKTILLGLLFIATVWIPNAFFAYYAYACIFTSGLFLLMNVVFLIDFSYQWSEDWGERMEVNSKWMWYLLAIAVLSYAAGIAITAACFVFFVPNSDCNYNAFAILSVAVSAVVYTVLSVYLPHGTIVSSGIVFAYTAGVMFCTLRMGNDAHCNTGAAPSDGPTSMKQILIDSLVSGFTLLYTVVSTGGNSKGITGVGADDAEEDPEESGHLGNYMFFYTVMMFGSMYLSMLATGWHVSGLGEGTVENSVSIAYWVRSGTVWSAVLLYLWSLLAPYYCCRDRDFGFVVDD